MREEIAAQVHSLLDARLQQAESAPDETRHQLPPPSLPRIMPCNRHREQQTKPKRRRRLRRTTSPSSSNRTRNASANKRATGSKWRRLSANIRHNCSN
jgi:hypothetical protein